MNPSFETLAIHGAQADPTAAPMICGAVTHPIFQTSTYAHSGDGVYDAVRYTRLSNGPSHLHLGAKLAALMATESALVTASGMAAITTTLLAHAQSGDRILFQRGVYGGTHMFATRDLPRYGIHADIAPNDDPSTWAAALHPTTRMIYVEAATNPLVQIVDLAAVVRVAREAGILAVIDATFMTPINLRPAALGFDLEFHSATKDLNGHSDLIAGVVAGRAPLVATVHHALNHLGGCLDPHACFLLERGLKTLPLRVRQHNQNALALARYLAARPDVTAVHYPGLDPERLVPSSVRAAYAGFGGVLSAELAGGAARADRVLASLRMAVHGPSLGGSETLVTRPATTSHAALAAPEREALGISDGLVRIACGLEGTEDLIADFAQALDATGPTAHGAGPM